MQNNVWSAAMFNTDFLFFINELPFYGWYSSYEWAWAWINVAMKVNRDWMFLKNGICSYNKAA